MSVYWYHNSGNFCNNLMNANFANCLAFVINKKQSFTHARIIFTQYLNGENFSFNKTKYLRCEPRVVIALS